MEMEMPVPYSEDNPPCPPLEKPSLPPEEPVSPENVSSPLNSQPEIAPPLPPKEPLPVESSTPSQPETTPNPTAPSNKAGGDASGCEDEMASSSRRRRSRWDPQPDSSEGEGGRKRKSRWAEDDSKPAIALPDFVKGLAELDPEVQALNLRLLEISRLLQSGLPLDDGLEGVRSPSPEPIYDNFGIRINTREFRARERLGRERQEIISQLIKRNPAFRPPADYRPPKLQKKLYIPMKEYPGYNFIGLVIGPRGNTQKRMEKETGAKIVVRGRGSVKEGRMQQKRDLKPDPAENEDLHVLVEAETQEALDAAVGMIEKLLQPIDEVLNEHKRQQLRELAALNGTIRDDEFCRLCGEPGHRQYACPSRLTTFKSDVLCKICGDGGHPTIDCPVKTTTGKKMDDEYQNFLAELGGGGGPGGSTASRTTLAIAGGPGQNLPNSDTDSMGKLMSAGKEYDDTNLYIGYLPPNLDDDGLIALFASFGVIVMAKVIKDRVSGLSKGYGFVKYSDADQAARAIAAMNGYRLEGRIIAVRVAGKPPQPTPPPVAAAFQGAHPNAYSSSQSYAPPALLGLPPPPGAYTGMVPLPWRPPVPWASPLVGQGYGLQYPAGVGRYPPHEAALPPPPPPPPSSDTDASQGFAYGGTSAPPGIPTSYAPGVAAPPPPFHPAGSYHMYYGTPLRAAVTPSSLEGSQTASSSVPWASGPVSQIVDGSKNTTGELEYEKFMSEMK